jgi:hypothetical protein
MSVETKRELGAFFKHTTIVRGLGLSWWHYSRYNSPSDQYPDQSWEAIGARLVWGQLE